MMLQAAAPNPCGPNGEMPPEPIWVNVTYIGLLVFAVLWMLISGELKQRRREKQKPFIGEGRESDRR